MVDIYSHMYNKQLLQKVFKYKVKLQKPQTYYLGNKGILKFQAKQIYC